MTSLRWAAVPALVLAGACAVTPRAPLPARDEAVVRAALSAWHASGKIGVRGADTGFSASFDWSETPDASAIDVRGPFGAGSVHIARSATRIVIDDGRAPPQVVEAPFDGLEAALATRLGAPLPLTSLRYWLLGIPDPDASATRDADNRFEQAGWTVTALDPQVVAGSPAPLPREVQMDRPPTRIKVVVLDWRIAPGAGPADTPP